MLDQTLFNPNQLHHYGTKVQDSPMSESNLSIKPEHGGFSMELSMEGTIAFANTYTHLLIISYDNSHISISDHHTFGIQ